MNVLFILLIKNGREPQVMEFITHIINVCSMYIMIVRPESAVSPSPCFFLVRMRSGHTYLSCLTICVRDFCIDSLLA